MKCPVDGAELSISDRQGVEIDFCPQCRGVWLDRGELDKILERSSNFDDRRGNGGGRDRRRDDDDDDDDGGGIGGFFGRLFDFG
jgi:Zn-finger nucleic acid-binding protein